MLAVFDIMIWMILCITIRSKKGEIELNVKEGNLKSVNGGGAEVN